MTFAGSSQQQEHADAMQFFPVFDFLTSTLFQQECKDVDQKVTPKCWEIQRSKNRRPSRTQHGSLDNSPFSLMIFPFQPPFCSGFSTSYS
jgi:hypothetical protein